MFLNLFLFYQVVRPLGHKSVNKYLCTCVHKRHLRTCRTYVAQVVRDDEVAEEQLGELGVHL